MFSSQATSKQFISLSLPDTFLLSPGPQWAELLASSHHLSSLVTEISVSISLISFTPQMTSLWLNRCHGTRVCLHHQLWVCGAFGCFYAKLTDLLFCNGVMSSLYILQEDLFIWSISKTTHSMILDNLQWFKAVKNIKHQNMIKLRKSQTTIFTWKLARPHIILSNPVGAARS